MLRNAAFIRLAGAGTLRTLMPAARSCAAWGIGVAVLATCWQLHAADVSADDPLVRSVRQAIAGALNTQLERARSNHPVPWGDPIANLTGSITVFAPALQGGRWCRSFKYVVRSSQDELTDSGLYCRGSVGLWHVAGKPEMLDKRAISAATNTPGVAAPLPDPSLLRLQQNLARLAYGGPDEGSTGTDVTAALSRFEDDTGMRQGTDPDTIARALTLSIGMLARSNIGGVCQAPDGEDGATLVCGRRR